MIDLFADGAFSFFSRGESGQWALKTEASGSKTMPVSRLPFLIGRASDCDLLLPDGPELMKSTSRWHCYFKAEADRIILVDGTLHPVPGTGKLKPSVSGTMLNGRFLQEPQAVASGDAVGIGPWRLRIADPQRSQVGIDDILKTIAGLPSRQVDPDDPRVAKAFSRLAPLFEELAGGGADAALGCVLAFALARMPRAVVAAILEEPPGGVLAVREARHKDLGRLPDLRFSVGLAAGLPADRAILLKAGSGAPSRSQRTQKVSSGLVVPLRGHGRRLGLLYIDNRGAGGGLGEEDLFLAHALAAVAALQLALERKA